MIMSFANTINDATSFEAFKATLKERGALKGGKVLVSFTTDYTPNGKCSRDEIRVGWLALEAMLKVLGVELQCGQAYMTAPRLWKVFSRLAVEIFSAGPPYDGEDDFGEAEIAFDIKTVVAMYMWHNKRNNVEDLFEQIEKAKANENS